jgi:hypothetical protein
VASAFSDLPEFVASRVQFAEEASSDLYEQFMSTRIDWFGRPSFSYLGHVSVGYFKRDKQLQEPDVTPLLKPFASHFPHLLYAVDDRYNVRDSDYMLSTAYALAEYTSMSRFGPLVVKREKPYLVASAMMVADAFSCISDSVLLDFDTSFDWLERQTSSGYPWTLVSPTKASFLDSDFYRTWYSSWETLVFSGRASPVCWKCFIKQGELKKRAVLLEHRPRTILASPMHFSQLGYRLFGVQNDRIARAGAQGLVPCWLGASKFHGHWDRLACRLLVFPNLGDGDITEFDGTVDQDDFIMLSDVRKRALPRDLSVGVNYYYDQVQESWIVSWLGDLFKKHRGQPSGQFNTLSDNSMVQCRYWFYHWCKFVVPHFHGVLFPTWASFKSQVCLVVMGDDVIYSCSNLVAPYFQPAYLKRTFASFGVKFKSTFDSLKQSLEGLEFCSLHFKYVEGYWVPVPKRAKALASVFYKGSTNPRVLLKRLMALRVEYWWEDDVRTVIEDLITLVRQTYSFELHKKPTGRGGDDMTLDDINSLYLGAHAIFSHYNLPIHD